MDRLIKAETTFMGGVIKSVSNSRDRLTLSAHY